MLPGQVTVIPLFLGFVEIGWINTFLPLILPAWLGQNVFALFLMRQFHRGIPFSLIEAARLDGASELQIIWSVIVPMSRPVLMAITVFAFIWSWNDLFNPLLYLHDERLYTMPIGLLYFISESSATGGGQAQVPWHLVMAVTTIMVLPVILVFFLAQRQFIQSIASAGVKG
jgi:ABC-type glycerol-3-phosphate transport system permease component